MGGAAGATVLIYHRIGGGTADELDVPVDGFRQQLDLLAGTECVSLDDAVDAVEAEDLRPRTVLTFDDGFRDVYDHAWPLLRERSLPFTVYLTTAYVGGLLRWEGSTARNQGAPALTWDQLAEMTESGLCTIGNHTHTHVRPELLVDRELDRCNDLVEHHLGVVPRHFAYTWGVPVPRMEPALRARFRTSATGRLGRVRPGFDPTRLPRIPVRRTDPLTFFRAKISGGLLPERAYGVLVHTAKAVGVRG